MTAALLPNAKAQFIDSTGKPLVGGKVYFYIPNTSTLKDTYQDAAQTILNTNPVILDANGQAIIWGVGAYRQVVYDQYNNLIWDQITEDVSSGLVGNFVDDVFISGTGFTPGTTTQLTLSSNYGSVDNVWLFFDGVWQGIDQIQSLSGNILTLTSPIPIGVSKVYVKGGTTISVGIAANNSVSANAIQNGAVSAKLATEAINQVPTGQFYSDLGARIDRFNDRVLVGAATVGDGKQTPTTRDWLDALITPSTSTAQLGVLSTVGQTGILGGTRSSDAANGGTQSCIGVVGICLNNATGATKQVGFGAYFEIDQSPNAGFSAALETDSVNQSGTVVALTPYSLFPSGAQPCVNAWFAAGGARTGVVNSSAGLVFLENGAQFEKGIIFQAGSVSSNEAIAFGQNHAIQWWASSTIGSGFINSTASTNNYGIAITDNGIFIGNSPASSQNSTCSLEVVNVNSAVNYVGIYGSISGVSPTIAALGMDANLNLALIPKGTGLIALGGSNGSSATAGSAAALPAAPQTYLNVIYTVDGQTYKIPLYKP